MRHNTAKFRMYPAAFLAAVFVLRASAPAGRAFAAEPAAPARAGVNRLVEARDRLMSLYDPGKGQWNGAEWWHQPVILGTMIGFARRSPADAQDVAALAGQVFDKNRNAQFINDYFDDTSWWAMCWLSAYEWTGDKRYLEAARTIFGHLTAKGWDEGSCGGGMIWSTGNHYKNAITNEQFARVAAWLYRLSVKDGQPDRAYLEWAEKSLAWLMGSGMQNGDGLFNDGLDNCRNNGQNPWTYNQGVILGALADMYVIKGDPAYLDRAYRIAEANLAFNSTDKGILLEKGCGDGDCGADGPIFKGVFLNGLRALLSASPADRPERKRIEEFLSRNSDAAWANRLDTGFFGVRWDRAQNASRAAAAQSAGMELLLATPADPSDQTAAPKICLYDKADFGGTSACWQVPAEIPMLQDNLQDKVSSIKTFPGACLTVYRDYGYKGDSRELSSSVNWVGGDWNDAITSFKAYPCKL